MGAHLAQEADRYAEQKKPVLWVEAAPRAYSMLAKRLESYPSQRAIFALLGDRDGVQTTFYISNNSVGVSSSIFQFGEYGSGDKSLWPEDKLSMVDSLTLPMTRLDSLLRSNGVDVAQYDLWVLDLQGAELLVLKGAGELLQQCRALLVEVSTVEGREVLDGWLVGDNRPASNPTARLLVPPKRLNPDTVRRPAELALVLLPNYANGAECELEALSKADAAVQLIGSLTNASAFPDNGFDEIVRLAKIVPAYSLRYSDFAQLGRSLGPLLARVGA